MVNRGQIDYPPRIKRGGKMQRKNDLINEIKNLKEFEMRPVAVERDGQFHVDSNNMAVVVKDENPVIAVTSKKYKLIQFSSVFLPVLSGVEGEFTGEIHTYKGKAWLYVFPEGENIGILLKNSVDKSTAIEANFAVMLNGYTVAIPARIKGFRKAHTGQALQITQDFLNGLGGIKNFWADIVKRYSDYNVDDEVQKEVFKQLKLTKKVKDRIENRKIDNLWSLFIAVLDELSKKHFKSDIHRDRKIQNMVEIFYNYSVGTRIMMM